MIPFHPPTAMMAVAAFAGISVAVWGAQADRWEQAHRPAIGREGARRTLLRNRTYVEKRPIAATCPTLVLVRRRAAVSKDALGGANKAASWSVLQDAILRIAPQDEVVELAGPSRRLRRPGGSFTKAGSH
jgi:hypothetical protein